ncbi:MAG: hypothetical protein C7B45_14530 [Sulfobacillus acidophilus]|uniref:Uncharacterized protein n=1 Tax=Sulfobacillus acidophilus TaxID=53633 RepID=A0A2T2WE73_9FIRM|nr:MAG: hypothetical protein C7B45_14530 [Sulfobacillus acidophilus]
MVPSVLNPIFKEQALKIQGRHLLIPLGRGRTPIRMHLPEALPIGTMAQAELGYGTLYLTVTRARQQGWRAGY